MWGQRSWCGEHWSLEPTAVRAEVEDTPPCLLTAWHGRAQSSTSSSLLPEPWGRTTHLQDEDSDERNGEDNHHLDELVVSHTVLAGEVILQQIWGPFQCLCPKEL